MNSLIKIPNDEPAARPTKAHQGRKGVTEAKSQDPATQGGERVTGRYDTTGNVEAQFEPGSNDRVLANKLGISDPEEMEDIEVGLLNRLHEDVIGSIEADRPITVADICEWHRCWLDNVYVWAGRYRTLNMAKGDFLFAASGLIPRLMDKYGQGDSPSPYPLYGNVRRSTDRSHRQSFTLS